MVRIAKVAWGFPKFFLPGWTVVERNLLCYQEVTRKVVLHLELGAEDAPGEVAWRVKVIIAECFVLCWE